MRGYGITSTAPDSRTGVEKQAGEYELIACSIAMSAGGGMVPLTIWVLFIVLG